MKETNPVFVRGDVAELLERARRACADAEKLSEDYRFIISWRQMRPRGRVRPSSMLDGED